MLDFLCHQGLGWLPNFDRSLEGNFPIWQNWQTAVWVFFPLSILHPWKSSFGGLNNIYLNVGGFQCSWCIKKGPMWSPCNKTGSFGMCPEHNIAWQGGMSPCCMHQVAPLISFILPPAWRNRLGFWFQSGSLCIFYKVILYTVGKLCWRLLYCKTLCNKALPALAAVCRSNFMPQ